MIFSTEIFLFVFFPFVLAVYYGLLRGRRNAQNVFLLLASLVFYAYGEPWFVSVMLLSILANWGFGRLAEQFHSRNVIVLMLVFNLGILGIFKYLMFVMGVLNHVLQTQWCIPVIQLPIGISFFTFQAISYVLDVYRKRCPAQKNPMNVGLYIAFFPQLIAGPIVRFETIAEEIQNRKESWNEFAAGAELFMRGMIKKVLLANPLALCADAAFEQNAFGTLSFALAWLGAAAYTFQIYYDFSGYSDMAIGLGKMFGFYFPKNFNHPYISRSVTEFWRRWHISLGTWFRDYLYIPLGGNRVSKGRFVVNLFLVWSLTGLWHGANWTFLCWGLMFFVFLIFEKFSGFVRFTDNLSSCKESTILRKWILLPFSVLYTFTVILCGLVVFRAETLPQGWRFLKTMFGMMPITEICDSAALFQFHEARWFLLVGMLFSFPIREFFEQKFAGKVFFYDILYVIILFLLFFATMSFVIQGGYNPFIYFNF